MDTTYNECEPPLASTRGHRPSASVHRNRGGVPKKGDNDGRGLRGKTGQPLVCRMAVVQDCRHGAGGPG